MPHTLTLSEARSCRHFAWHPLGFLLVDSRLVRAVVKEPPASEGYGEALHVTLSTLDDAVHLVEDGWYHLEDCSCELCRHRHSIVASPPGA